VIGISRVAEGDVAAKAVTAGIEGDIVARAGTAPKTQANSSTARKDKVRFEDRQLMATPIFNRAITCVAIHTSLPRILEAKRRWLRAHDALGFGVDAFPTANVPRREDVIDGKMPEPESQAGKIYRGKFLIRIPPGVHRKLALKAMARGESLNQFVAEALTRA
jgi:HicB family